MLYFLIYILPDILEEFYSYRLNTRESDVGRLGFGKMCNFSCEYYIRFRIKIDVKFNQMMKLRKPSISHDLRTSSESILIDF